MLDCFLIDWPVHLNHRVYWAKPIFIKKNDLVLLLEKIIQTHEQNKSAVQMIKQTVKVLRQTEKQSERERESLQTDRDFLSLVLWVSFTLGQASLHLLWHSLITAFTHRLQVDLNKLIPEQQTDSSTETSWMNHIHCVFMYIQLWVNALESQFGVACGACEAVDTPGLIQCRHNWNIRKHDHLRATRGHRTGTQA